MGLKNHMFIMQLSFSKSKYQFKLKTWIYTELNGLFCYFMSQDESKNMQFTVLTDRSQGGGSIQDGYHQLQAHLKVLQHPENHPTADDDVPYKKM
jgi:hypothetical protein